MKPITTPITFYIGKDHFEITENVFCKNGEVLEEGKMFIFNLLLGQPVWVICIQNDYTPPTYIKTKENVTSVLPVFEVFEGEYYPQKNVFAITYSYQGHPQTMKILAVDEIHARSLCRMTKKVTEQEIIHVEKGDTGYATV